MNFEFLYANYLDTTTMVKVNNGTSSVQYLFDRDSSKQFSSSGDNDDTTATVIDVEFASAKNIDHIVIQNCNFKDFTVYYNSNTANKFTLLNAETTTSDWTQNSDTSLYLYFSTISVNSISIVASATMVANQEKRCGQLWATRRYYRLVNNPSAREYKALDERKEYVHNMANGGYVTYVIGDKYRADFKIPYISTSERTSLRALYDEKTDFVIAPFPTGTSWTDDIYAVNWVGDFDFLQPAGNNWAASGWTGSIRVREIP